MKTNNEGIKLIMDFEGCYYKAQKCLSTEKYLTIGYGHYGADVNPGQTITKEEAKNLLKKDLTEYEYYVNKYFKTTNQNIFNALVSFCYNCGPGSLKSLCNGRNIYEIAENITKYNKSGGNVIKGLTNRRNKEKEIIIKEIKKIVNTNSGKLNFRKTANGEIIQGINKGENVYILDFETIKKNNIEWIKIYYKGNTGYVAKKYLK